MGAVAVGDQKSFGTTFKKLHEATIKLDEFEGHCRRTKCLRFRRMHKVLVTYESLYGMRVEALLRDMVAPDFLGGDSLIRFQKSIMKTVILSVKHLEALQPYLACGIPFAWVIVELGTRNSIPSGMSYLAEQVRSIATLFSKNTMKNCSANFRMK